VTPLAMLPRRQFGDSVTRSSGRNPFPGSYFFPVPIRLWDSGLIRVMWGCELKRYLTFLRLANWGYGRTQIRASCAKLATLDGVSARSAWSVHRRLMERGLICIDNTRPPTYTLVHPDYWADSEKSKSAIPNPFFFTSQGTLTRPQEERRSRENLKREADVSQLIGRAQDIPDMSARVAGLGSKNCRVPGVRLAYCRERKR
jgi:hypothetical protein